MHLHRRRVLSLLGGVGALAIDQRAVLAGGYPTRPVHVAVGVAAGGPADIYARVISRWLAKRLGQPFVIDNRPGAGTNIATEFVVRAPADGHTLLWVTLTNAINTSLYDKLNFDFVRDIEPIASVSRNPLVMAVNPAVPARSVPELIAYCKANPGKLSMASAGKGTPMHVSGELFKMMAGVEIVHVPYRGEAPALTDVMSGQVHLYFGTAAATLEHIKAGRLRGLAVTTSTPSELLPGVPTLGSTLPGYEATGWFGVGAPRNTPSEIIEMLNHEINAVLENPTVQRRFADLGSAVFTSSSAGFRKFIAEETKKWREVAAFAHLAPE